MTIFTTQCNNPISYLKLGLRNLCIFLVEGNFCQWLENCNPLPPFPPPPPHGKDTSGQEKGAGIDFLPPGLWTGLSSDLEKGGTEEIKGIVTQDFGQHSF